MKTAQMSTALRSTMLIPVNESGVMRAEPPRIRSVLEMLEPSMFPSASWPLPLRAATMLVASSGIEVPAASTVTAINLSDTPKPFAISVAAFTKSLPPKISAESPPRMSNADTIGV